MDSFWKCMLYCVWNVLNSVWGVEIELELWISVLECSFFIKGWINKCVAHSVWIVQIILSLVCLKFIWSYTRNSFDTMNFEYPCKPEPFQKFYGVKFNLTQRPNAGVAPYVLVKPHLKFFCCISFKLMIPNWNICRW